MILKYKDIANKTFASGLSKLLNNDNLPIMIMLSLSKMYDEIVKEEKRYLELRSKLYKDNVHEVNGVVEFINKEKADICKFELNKLDVSEFTIDVDSIEFKKEDVDSYNLTLTVLELKSLNIIMNIV